MNNSYPDRHDTCAAYYMYSVIWGPVPSIECRLDAIRYRPSRSEEYIHGLSENAKVKLGDLVMREQPYATIAQRICRKRRIPWHGNRYYKSAAHTLASALGVSVQDADRAVYAYMAGGLQ